MGNLLPTRVPTPQPSNSRRLRSIARRTSPNEARSHHSENVRASTLWSSSGPIEATSLTWSATVSGGAGPTPVSPSRSQSANSRSSARRGEGLRRERLEHNACEQHGRAPATSLVGCSHSGPRANRPMFVAVRVGRRGRGVAPLNTRHHQSRRTSASRTLSAGIVTGSERRCASIRPAKEALRQARQTAYSAATALAP